MNIRKAEIDDAKGIARVHVDSWRTTYKGIIPDKVLSGLSYGQRTELWQRNILRDGNYVFVAENEQKEIVGFADCGRRDTNKIKDSGDLTSIYLLEDYQGVGIGKQLMKRLFKQFEKLGYNRVFVEVLKDNKTQFFYEHYGAILIKAEVIKMAGAELELFIYEWEDVRSVVI
ncbi:GNAT family N-acetyltransferase [Jeotgalibacillus salarius]|uniref:GNAT family N-acetyltransferase n=1 Tax=Jeotgalibacillus salarius TaxID=546023 RepID=A0A4Y8LAS3_9BACL|nr:GNAT family N-acetyltransferase [Jeotgalibacillus salarius]TFD99477.1 GNAT family N-acetyltransferase [Jeotgalibacillus salarius]